MIKIDRSSSISVPEQIAEQLRFSIASRQYKVNDTLPPTRKMADQVGVSFHTVRKAYQLLVDEGILEVQQGRGYSIASRVPLSNEEQLERGAEIVQKALQQLVGLGLDESEIEYLVEEQLAIMDLGATDLKMVFIAPYMEMAEHCAQQIGNALQMNLEPLSTHNTEGVHDADYLFCPIPLVKQINESFPKIDVLGTTVYLTPDTLDRIARLLSHESLGLVTFYDESIPHLMGDIQRQTGFGGQILGASLEKGTTHMAQFIRQVDMIIYTPLSRRRALPFIKQAGESGTSTLEISHLISPQSLNSIQQLIPSL